MIAVKRMTPSFLGALGLVLSLVSPNVAMGGFRILHLSPNTPGRPRADMERLQGRAGEIYTALKVAWMMCAENPAIQQAQLAGLPVTIVPSFLHHFTERSHIQKTWRDYQRFKRYLKTTAPATAAEMEKGEPALIEEMDSLLRNGPPQKQASGPKVGARERRLPSRVLAKNYDARDLERMKAGWEMPGYAVHDLLTRGARLPKDLMSDENKMSAFNARISDASTTLWFYLRKYHDPLSGKPGVPEIGQLGEGGIEGTVRRNRAVAEDAFPALREMCHATTRPLREKIRETEAEIEKLQHKFQHGELTPKVYLDKRQNAEQRIRGYQQEMNEVLQYLEDLRQKARIPLDGPLA